MREGLGMLATVVLLAIVGIGCSGGEDGAAGKGAERKADQAAASPVQNDLGNQAFQPSTRLAVPDGTPRRLVEELGRAFVATSSSKTFERALVGSAREPMPRGTGEFAGYVEEQARRLSEAESSDR